MFGVLYGPEGTPPGSLAEVAREFSPRIEGPSLAGVPEVVIDLSGLLRLFGDARTMAEQLRRMAADRGLRVRIAIAGTRTAARLLARHRAGVTIVEPGSEGAALAPLPIALIGEIGRADRARGEGEDLIATFRRWGLRTLGDLAALPADEIAARLGRNGLEWQRQSRGEDAHPLVPSIPEERFEQSLDLEWPIEGLEPLSFVLGRLLEPLSAHLERRDRGAAVLHVRLHQVRMTGADRQVHERSLQLPIPIRDARTLRTLVLLDLESHPPAGPIERVTVAVDPTPGRIVQFSLLTRPLPTPEQVSTLMARLQALMGETRCGSPVMVDSWRPGAFAMKAFAPLDSSVGHQRHDTPRHRDTEAKTSRSVIHDRGASVPQCVGEVDGAAGPVVALRRFRHPVPVRVQVTRDKPSSVTIHRRGLSGGGVESCAGPWRTSGGWWAEEGASRASGADRASGSPSSWDRDEWDVTLTGGASYRLFRDRHADRWFLEGIVD